ncbi:toprim domain-containing protein [Candidatus Micrarchaeota archaeon]|nr:toprim domain-containing protein [Candidatus Micrarchaeota archaeon]
MRYGNRKEMKEKYKKLLRLLAVLERSVVLVEGKRDKKALEELGCRRVITVSGRVRDVCESLEGEQGRVVIATDLDRSGNELARMAREELEAHSLGADSETRVLLARILKMRYFEDAKRRYDEFIEEVETSKIG